jgi:hypothetical protein
MDAGTASRWLKADPPNLAEVWELLASIAKEGRRASDIIARIRALAKKDPIKMDRLNINDAIREVIALARTEITRKRVTLDARLADAAPVILGDRVQLQQVMLNLILNAVEAMSDGEPESCSSKPGGMTGPARSFPSATRAQASKQSSPIASLRLFTRPNPAEWVSACRSAARSSRGMGGRSGRVRTRSAAAPFSSPFPLRPSRRRRSIELSFDDYPGVLRPFGFLRWAWLRIRSVSLSKSSGARAALISASARSPSSPRLRIRGRSIASR